MELNVRAAGPLLALAALVVAGAAAAADELELVGLSPASGPGTPGSTVAPGMPPGGKPEITSKKGITVGTVFIAWGGTGTLKAADAIQSSPNNACAFNATYDMVNVGPVATSPAFLNRLKVDATSVVAVNSGLALNAGETKNVTTQPYLPFGTHRLTLSLDDDGNVAESDESPASNVKTATYTLQGPCGAAPKPAGAAAPKR